jgi:glycosyltransferase involved in cell wall biosynthesis
MLLILRPPHLLKTGSDVLNESMMQELNACGLPCKILELWSETAARVLFTKRLPGAHYFFGKIIVPLCHRMLQAELKHANAVMVNGFSGYNPNQYVALELKIQKNGAKYLFFIQDDWLDIEDRRKATLKCISLSDATVVPTYALRERFLRDAPTANIVVLEEPIDVMRVRPSKAVEKSGNADLKPVILWTGNPANIRELPGAFGLLKEIADQLPFTLRVVSGQRKPSLDLPFHWDWRPYSERAESENLAGATLGLAPLKDTPYNRCKDMYKIKTYFAAGIPVVASPVGHNCDMVVNGVTGFLATTHQEWTESILRLLRDPVLSKAMGRNARQDCIRRFSHKAVAASWVSALKPFSMPVGGNNR